MIYHSVRTSEALLQFAAQLRQQNRQVVMSGGVFDLFHAGHVHYLNRAASFGIVHVVAVNSDESVKLVRGREPYIGEQERASIVDAMRCVSAVVLFDGPDPLSAIEAIRPAVFCKGDEYAGQNISERANVQAYGGRLVLIPQHPQRSSAIVAKIKGA